MVLKYIQTLLIVLFLFNSSYGQDIKVTPININTPNDEYAPMYYKEGLYITSNRKNSNFENYAVKDKNGDLNNLSNIYNLTYNADSSAFNIVNKTDINSPNLHEGPCSFSEDFDTIYFARTILTPKEKSNVGLFMSINIDGVWQAATPLNINSSEYNLSHPYISPKGDKIYYVSDKNGGFGKMDIWYSIKKENNKWSEPINMGNKINTPYDEVFPYLSLKDILYFASNKPDSKGGFDIFYTSLKSTINIQTFDSPINSKANDYSYISLDNGKTGYFSSNRKKKKDDDIYAFNSVVEFDNCEESFIPRNCFTFYDLEVKNNEDHIKYIWDFGDGIISHDFKAYHCFDSPGDKIIKLSLIDTMTGQVTQNISSFGMNIKEPIDYYFDSQFLSQKKNQNLKVIDYSNKSPIEDNITWKIDNDYYFNQDTLAFESPYPGEYHVKALLPSSCLQSNLIVAPKDSTHKQFKIIPSQDSLSIISAFISSQIEENVINGLKKGTLIIPLNQRKKTLEWANKFIRTCLTKYNLQIETSYPLKTEFNYIFLNLN